MSKKRLILNQYQFVIIMLVLLLTHQSFASGMCSQLFFEASQKAVTVFQTHDAKKLSYKISGDPDSPNVVLFLNGLDKNYNAWNEVRDIILDKHPHVQYIQLDLLGQGETSRLNRSQTTIPYQNQIEALKEFISNQKLNEKNLILIGHSYGGGIAARFTRDNPNIVKRAILISPFVDNLETYAGPAMAMIKSSYEMFGLKSLYDAQVQSAFAMGVNAFWNPKSSPAQTSNKSDVIALTGGIRNINMRQSIAQINHTTVDFIISNKDELIPNRAHSELYDHLSPENRGYFLRINASHDSPTTAPENLAAALLHIFGR